MTTDTHLAAPTRFVEGNGMTAQVIRKDDVGLKALLSRQRAAFLRDGPPPLEHRRSDLKKLKHALLAHREGFITAINVDFGHRSRKAAVTAGMGKYGA